MISEATFILLRGSPEGPGDLLGLAWNRALTQVQSFYSRGCRLWLGETAPALAATCLPSGSSAWAFPTEGEINKAVNNLLPVRRKDRRALGRDNGRCRATRGPANLVPRSGTETAERRIADSQEQLDLQGFTLQGNPKPASPRSSYSLLSRTRAECCHAPSPALP